MSDASLIVTVVSFTAAALVSTAAFFLTVCPDKCFLSKPVSYTSVPLEIVPVMFESKVIVLPLIAVIVLTFLLLPVPNIII